MRLAVVVLLALNAIVLTAGLRGALPLPASAPAGVAMAPAQTQQPGPRLDLLREIAPNAANAPSGTRPARPVPVDSVAPQPASAPDPAPSDARPADPALRPPRDDPAAAPAPGASSVRASAPPASARAAKDAQDARCHMLGPAGTGAGKTLRDLTALLEKAGASNVTAVEQRTGPVRHWVVLPGFASTDQARAALARLTDAGITDTAILPDGDAGYLVSLGVFAQRAGAQRHAATVRAAGFEAQLRQRATGPVRQWVRATLPGPAVDDLRLPAGVRVTPCAADSG